MYVGLNVLALLFGQGRSGLAGDIYSGVKLLLLVQSRLRLENNHATSYEQVTLITKSVKQPRNVLRKYIQSKEKRSL